MVWSDQFSWARQRRTWWAKFGRPAGRRGVDGSGARTKRCFLSAIVFEVSVQSPLCFAPNPALQWTVPGAIRGVKFGALSSIFIASDRRQRISGPATELGSLGCPLWKLRK
jgi:hypothetical protein